MHIVLNSFGASLRKENDLFLITTPEGNQHVLPDEVRSITISRGARISSDAVLLAIEHEIDVLFVDRKGMPQGRVWSVKYGSISTIRQKQIEFLYSRHLLAWVKEIINEKIENQITLLLAYQPTETNKLYHIIQGAINAMEDHRQKVKKCEADYLSDISATLRGWEGAASRRYFQAVSELLPEAYRFEKRSTHPAKDPFNATLNYAYGMLYAKVESALIKAGIDPYVGMYHRDEYNRPALVFDVIEKYRIWADYTVIQLFRQDAFCDECFINDGNTYWLDGLGKRILIQSMNDYLSEIITINKTERSRASHIDLYAQSLAKKFLSHDSYLNDR